jgi:hypothetical protein
MKTGGETEVTLTLDESGWSGMFHFVGKTPCIHWIYLYDGLYLNPGPPEYEIVLTARPRRSVVSI